MFCLKQIAEYTHGSIVHGKENTVVENFSIVKRTMDLKNYFFIPITFQKKDREIYILDHVRNGCIGFMINRNSVHKQEIEEEAIQINPNICILEVKSVNQALFQLGEIQRRKNIDKPVIAVTGSVGKTTLCNLIARILSTERKVLYDFNSDNNNTKMHVSLSYLYFDNYDMAVTEFGITDFGIMHQMSKLALPSIAVINSIGTAHINHLKSKENILEEKMHITDYLQDKKIFFVNEDDEYLKTVKESNHYQLIHYSIKNAKNIVLKDGKVSFTTKIYDKDTDFDLELYGSYHIRNIVLAIRIAEIYHIKYENIVKAIHEFMPVDGRFKVFKNKENGITVIDDTYNSCFESITCGLDIANQMGSNRKIAVLGTIGSGINGKEDTSLLHEQVGKYFENLNFDYLYLTGDYTKHILKGALNSLEEKNIKKFKTKELLISELQKNIKDGDLVYIKDAGLQEFEKIVYSLKKEYNLI